MRFFTINRNPLSKSLSSSNLWYKPSSLFSADKMRFFSINRNLLSKSPNLWLGRHTSRVVSGLKPNNESMLLIHHSNIFRSSKPHSLLLTELNSWKKQSLECPSLGHEHVVFCACCNGLVLVSLSHKINSNPPTYALWNPKTNNIISINPTSHIPFPRHPSIELGFDPASQDHKVIKFLDFFDEDTPEFPGIIHFRVELYSLKTGSWKEITTFPSSCFRQLYPSVYINGVVYWKTSDGFIISFEFANEKFSSAPHIPLPGIVKPPVTSENMHNLNANEKLWLFDGFILGEFHGLLAAVLHSKLRPKTDLPELRRIKTKPFDFEIWVWNADEESWSKVVPTIPIDALDGVSKVLGLSNNETLILQGLDGELLLFNWKTRVLEKINIKAHFGSHFKVFPFVPM